jgi:RNA polymerase-interacting CarD/CdnL/TRCF family regulator
MRLPAKIIIKKGQLEMDDGSDLVKYLKRWQKQSETPDGEYVNILNHARAVIEREALCFSLLLNTAH